MWPTCGSSVTRKNISKNAQFIKTLDANSNPNPNPDPDPDLSHINFVRKKLVDQNIFDIFIQCGNVINPANQTNDLLNIAIQADTIAAISSQKLQGKLVLDATNLIVSPGFIDLHAHTLTPLGQYYQLYTTGHFRSQKSDRQFY